MKALKSSVHTLPCILIILCMHIYMYVKIQSYTVCVQNEVRECTGRYTVRSLAKTDHEVIEDSAPRVALACCLRSEVSQVVLNLLLVL